jgi:membrane-associated protein
MHWLYELWEVLHSIEDIVLRFLLAYPIWVLLGLFGILFLESSVLPFLPGDTLLFASGVALRTSPVSVHAAVLLFCAATVLGVTLNYVIGRRLRLQIQQDGFWGLNPRHLRRAEALMTTYGPRLLVLGRFLPGVRVAVSLLAGSGRMAFGAFTLYNVIGGAAWVSLFVYAGYTLGGLPGAHAYLVPAVLLLFAATLIPLLVGWARASWHRAHPNGPSSP